MCARKPKPINLSASVATALSAILHALEVVEGCSLALCYDVGIHPQSLATAIRDGKSVMLRTVSLTGTYRRRLGDQRPRSFCGDVELIRNDDDTWRPIEITNFGVGLCADSDSRKSFGHVHFRDDGSFNLAFYSGSQSTQEWICYNAATGERTTRPLWVE